MFIQVIEGKTKNPDGVHERLEVWKHDLMPTAIGYLGSTGGCTRRIILAPASERRRRSAKQRALNRRW
jgi:hypothetical protein